MSNIPQLAEKLRRLEVRFNSSFQSISREGLNIRYTEAVNLAAEGGATLDMLHDRNLELVEENTKLRDLLFRVMEKSLDKELDL